MDKIKPTPKQQTKRIEQLVLIIKSNLKFKDLVTIIEHIKLFRVEPCSKYNPRELDDWFDFLIERVNGYNTIIDFSKEQVKLILEYCNNLIVFCDNLQSESLIKVSNNNYYLAEFAQHFETNSLNDFEFNIFESIELWKNIKQKNLK